MLRWFCGGDRRAVLHEVRPYNGGGCATTSAANTQRKYIARDFGLTRGKTLQRQTATWIAAKFAVVIII